MTSDNKNTDKLSQVMQEALFQLKQLVINKDQSQQPNFLGVVETFLLDVIFNIG